MTGYAHFLRDEKAAGAAEFALVLPAALLLFFGVIDGGRYLWSVNRLEKAVQMGTRTAVVTNVVASSLNTANYTATPVECPTYNDDGTPTGDTTVIKPGDPICKEAVPTLICAKSGTNVSCGNEQGNAAAFDRIVSRMRVVDPSIGDDEVTITYSGSGIGYADDPSEDDDGNALADAAPVVTVAVDRARMRALFLLGGSIPLPGFSYSQTLEDGDGQVSY
ncbi:TadE/TadG family type IV pilus assembly protein [Tsuneonella amylolytica]|uniref:TadE/TadG family type IV pilus assembly protein n=1 Tax=Tsuneonella amylolytica TaxID=2338327 RepID=UPI0013C4F515|nr:TadE/TadG family type IV pilus assembly protein [Tsuneonella amylolytica]